MPLDQLLTVKLEIEGLKQRIGAMLFAESEDLNRQIAEAMDKALQSYDLEAKVQDIVHASLNKALENYFSFGDGYRAICSTIAQAFEQAEPEA